MIFKLLSHQFKALRRSPFWTQSVVQTIVLGLFALYLLLMALGIGFTAPHFIQEFYPNENLIKNFSFLYLPIG